MIQYQKMDIDERKKERIVYRREMLHYGLFLSRPEEAGRDIPWHWHEEFEIGYVSAGCMQYKTNHHEFILEEGDGIFINSGVLHYLHPIEGKGKTEIHTHFFDKTFLAGSPGSLLDIKYVKPVMDQRLLSAVPLYHNVEEDRIFLEKIKEAEKICLQEDNFFELKLRNLFSELWEIIYLWGKDKKKEEKDYNLLEDERIKKMLSYIQLHYKDKILTDDLAEQANISERECYRIFRNGLGTTPAEFIITWRLQKAGELLQGTKKSIMEVAQETGFETSSYFCKLFKQRYHLTPNKYRKYSENPGE